MAQVYPFVDPVSAETTPPVSFVRGSGIRVYDADGKAYIDAVSALWCSSLGFNPKRLQDVMQRQAGDLAYYHSFMGRTPEVANDLAEHLVARLPGMARVFFGTSGSEAVETAAKFSRFYWNAKGQPEKKRMIARDGAYHGSIEVSAALTGMAYCHDGFDVPLDGVLRTGRPHYLRDAEPGESETAFSRRRGQELDALIRAADPGTIGAFIGEPAMGAGGVILPPDGYWDEIQEVLARHDILLIADEIICGFGRTGEWFACETYGIRPDMMTLAKQLTASIFPMSAVAMTEKVYEAIRSLGHEKGTLGHGVTYGGHPIGAAVANECLTIYEELDLPVHVKALGMRIEQGLRLLRQKPGVIDTRCKGMLAAVEFETAEQAAMVGREAEGRGVFFRIIGPVLAIAPPYICTEAEIDDIMGVMHDAIDAASGNP